MMRALSLLIKPASGNCDMRCRYCFYADISDIREVKNHGIMSFELLEILLKKALSETSEFLSLGFQGGEPTLASIDFFRELIRIEKKYNINNIKISHSLQTNGLSLNSEWAEFFRENNFLIGLSIDSTKEIHDFMRLDAKGAGTHSRCLKSARLLNEHKVDFNILSVVTRYLGKHPDKVYRFYKKYNFRFIQFIPCLDGLEEGHGSNDYSLDADTYGKFLCRLFDLWHQDFIKEDYFSIRTFDNYIQMLAGYPPENCAMRGVCGAYGLIEADGSVYPCDFYALDPFLLGNIRTNGFKEMLFGEKAATFAEESGKVRVQCEKCEYFFICRGGCRRDRETKEGEISLNCYCRSYKVFFKHALERMKLIAAKLR